MNSIDITVFNFINGLAESVSTFNPFVIFLVKYSFWLLIAFVVLSWLFDSSKLKNRKMLASSLITFVVALIVGKILGIFIHHAPPGATIIDANQLVENSGSNSFPSVYAIFFFSFAFCIYFFSRGWSGSIIIFFSILVGIALIWAGASYPSDVLGSVVISLVVALIFAPIGRNSNMLEKPVRAYNNFERKIFKRKLNTTPAQARAKGEEPQKDTKPDEDIKPNEVEATEETQSEA